MKILEFSNRFYTSQGGIKLMDKTEMVRNIIFYLIVVNIIGYAMMWYDKRCAQNGQWRIKEKTLFIIALIGGSIGSLIGIHQFRHKTKHLKFTIGIPVILVLQIAGFIIIKMRLQGEILRIIKNWI